MLVHSELAWAVLDALKQRFLANKRKLRNTDVVVTEEMKPLLLEAVRRLSPRINEIKRTVEVQLGPQLYDNCDPQRVFIDFNNTSLPSSVTHSTSDTHQGHQNHRKRARALFESR